MACVQTGVGVGSTKQNTVLNPPEMEFEMKACGKLSTPSNRPALPVDKEHCGTVECGAMGCGCSGPRSRGCQVAIK